MISHFSKLTIFVWFFGSTFPICSTILSTPIPIVFLSSFSTWEFHSHFVKVKYTIGGPIGRNVVCFGSSLCFVLYSNNSPQLCFPSLGRLYTYSRSRIRRGSYFFMIAGRIFKTRDFNVVIEVCSLVSTGV